MRDSWVGVSAFRQADILLFCAFFTLFDVKQLFRFSLHFNSDEQIIATSILPHIIK